MFDVKPGDYIRKNWRHVNHVLDRDYVLVIAVHNDRLLAGGLSDAYMVTYLDRSGKLDWAWDTWFSVEKELSA